MNLSNSWETMINQTDIVVPKAEAQAAPQSTYYKEKYGESDYVLMFWNPTEPLQQWMIIDLLEGIDVRARGIRVGKTGKCYADFENEEIMERVRQLDGESVGDVIITISDVPQKVDPPKNNFNKSKTPKKMENEQKRGNKGKMNVNNKRNERNMKRNEEEKDKEIEKQEKNEEDKEMKKEDEKEGNYYNKRNYNNNYNNNRRHYNNYNYNNRGRNNYNNRGQQRYQKDYSKDKVEENEKKIEQNEMKKEEKVEETKIEQKIENVEQKTIEKTEKVEEKKIEKVEEKKEDERKYQRSYGEKRERGMIKNYRGKPQRNHQKPKQEINWDDVKKDGHQTDHQLNLPKEEEEEKVDPIIAESDSDDESEWQTPKQKKGGKRKKGGK